MAGTKQPAIMLYVGDWMKAPEVRCLSNAAKGLWVDMLMLMSECPEKGRLRFREGRPATAAQIARMTGSQIEEVQQLLDELEDAGTFSRDENDQHIYCRRMVRDAARVDALRENGKKGGRPPREGQNQQAKQTETKTRDLGSDLVSESGNQNGNQKGGSSVAVSSSVSASAPPQAPPGGPGDGDALPPPKPSDEIVDRLVGLMSWKRGKVGAVRRAMVTALTKVDAATLEAAIAEYAASPVAKSTAAVEPHNWLANEQWADDRERWKAVPSTSVLRREEPRGPKAPTDTVADIERRSPGKPAPPPPEVRNWAKSRRGRTNDTGTET